MAQEKRYNRLDTALTVADALYDCMEMGITSITTRELLEVLGVKNPQFEYENVEFDLSTLATRQNLEKLEEAIYQSPYFTGKGELEAA